MKLTIGIAASTASMPSKLARPNSHSSAQHEPYQSRIGQLFGQGLSGGSGSIGGLATDSAISGGYGMAGG